MVSLASTLKFKPLKLLTHFSLSLSHIHMHIHTSAGLLLSLSLSSPLWVCSVYYKITLTWTDAAALGSQCLFSPCLLCNQSVLIQRLHWFPFSSSLHSRHPLFPLAHSLHPLGTGGRAFCPPTLAQPYNKGFEGVVTFQVQAFTPTAHPPPLDHLKSC